MGGDLQRFLVDPFIQPTQKAKKLVEDLVDTAKRTGSSIEQIADRWAESLENVGTLVLQLKLLLRRLIIILQLHTLGVGLM